MRHLLFLFSLLLWAWTAESSLPEAHAPAPGGENVRAQSVSDGSRQSKSAIQTFLWQTLLLGRDPSLTLRALTLAGSVADGQGSPTSVDLLIRNGYILTMDASFNEFRPGFVAIRGSRIAAVGPMSEAARFAAKETIDAAGKIVMPGLINTHTHAPMTLFRGLGGDSDLMEWLQKYIFPAEARNVNPDLVKWGTQLACYEMIQSGTTTFIDMYYFEDDLAAAVKAAGMRGVLGETIIDMAAPDNKTSRQALSYTRKFIEHWRQDLMITPAVAPHAAYTCSKETLQQSQKLANEFHVPLITHLSETETEVKNIRAKYGSTPAAYLDSFGFLQDSLIAAHCVWITDQEIPLLKKNGVGVAHNPESNMKLASGVAPLKKFLDAGIAVGLGTDGAASNNNLDMFEEIDSMAKLHKLWNRDPAFLSAKEAVRIATRGGAEVLDRQQDLGSLEPGKLADMILVRATDAPAIPMYDVYAQLAYALKGWNVDSSVINGKIVMRNRVVRTINFDVLRENVERLRRQVVKSLALRQ
ncbi:MAG TPA: amidohydrolase [Acidobacteriota bacterium]|jgi:5-methylthioadenosine/S-adenosylhomocysteine deaminase|nr:amidohydrolase [Acidobacteriota bacterium]